MWRLFLAGALVAIAGCDSGPKLVDVQGTLLVGGKPLEKIHIEFWPVGNGPRSVGRTDAQGKFTLLSDDGKKGAFVGKHKIVLRDEGIITNKTTGRAAEDIDITEGKKPRIAKLYDDAHKSPLSVEIAAGQKTVELAAEPNSER